LRLHFIEEATVFGLSSFLPRPRILMGSTAIFANTPRP